MNRLENKVVLIIGTESTIDRGILAESTATPKKS